MFKTEMTVLTVVFTHMGKCSQSQTIHLEEQTQPSFFVHYILELDLIK